MGWVVFFFEEFCTRHDEAGDAVSTLNRIVFDEFFLYGVKLTILLEAFH